MATVASSAKPSPLPILNTPVSDDHLLPSELPRSPLSALGGAIKQEEDVLKTPITPPTAYTDFLKALSPAVSTPLTATSTKSSFSFSDRSGRLTPITQPSSASSSCSCLAVDEPKRKLPPVASAPLVPPSPFVRPAPARRPSARTPTTLKKLQIPESPTSSVFSQSPRSATPRSAAPRSAAPRSAAPRSATPRSSTASALRSPFSPTSWYIEGRTKVFGAPPTSAGGSSQVSVKQVVTRTITYTSKPLDPAPRGKRRKLDT